jgi:cytosine deaminase
MDFVLKNARVPADPGAPVDIAVDAGRIVAVEAGLEADAPVLDVAGRLVCPGFVETHIHLDKSCLLDRCAPRRGTLEEAIETVSRAKRDFTPEDVYERGKRTLEKAISHGTTHMRTHVEVDPVIGLDGLRGVLSLAHDHRWAVDVEICVFPQEGLYNNPGTDALLVAALKEGATVIGAAPYTDSQPRAQIDRIFELARAFDVDIDMHLDFSTDASTLDLHYVCDLTERFGRGGRVAIGHVSKLSTAPPDAFEAAARRLADAGVALTVLPSTDLFLMGRERTHAVVRGVANAHALVGAGVNCSVSTNNVLNPFTPFGDCSLLRLANMNANVCQAGSLADLRVSLEMVSSRPAALMNIADYGIAPGRSADLVVLDAHSPEMAVAEIAPVLHAFKRGRRTVTRPPVRLHRPD